MTKQQIAIVWIVGLLVSAVLVYIGIGKPYLHTKNTTRPGPGRFAIATADQRASQESWEEKGTPNYYIGALAPVVILGACAGLSTMRKPDAGAQ